MALSYSNLLNAARLDQIETYIGASPYLKVYEGVAPLDVTVALGAQLIILDTQLAQAAGGLGDWMEPATNARPSQKVKKGVWSGIVHANAGVGKAATFFRITTSGGVAAIQGSCGQGTGDLQFDNATLATGQTVTVNTFTISSAN